MVAPAHPVTFRRCQAIDYSSVARLWTRINRGLAPIGMEKLFDRYIAMTIDHELKQLPQVSAACAHRGRPADPAHIRFSPPTSPYMHWSKSIETLLPILNLKGTSTSDSSERLPPPRLRGDLR
jgi:hypothetical protein